MSSKNNCEYLFIQDKSFKQRETRDLELSIFWTKKSHPTPLC